MQVSNVDTSQLELSLWRSVSAVDDIFLGGAILSTSELDPYLGVSVPTPVVCISQCNQSQQNFPRALSSHSCLPVPFPPTS